LRASKDIEGYCLDRLPDLGWGDDALQAWYLEAVRLALIGKDAERAKQLLAVDLPFDYHREEYELLKVLATERQPPPPLEHGVILDFFDHYFDWVRDPSLRPQAHMDREMVRFEMGILREQYFTSPDGGIDWKRVIEVISQ
jgi:hypothetical protein